MALVLDIDAETDVVWNCAITPVRHIMEETCQQVKRSSMKIWFCHLPRHCRLALSVGGSVLLVLMLLIYLLVLQAKEVEVVVRKTKRGR